MTVSAETKIRWAAADLWQARVKSIVKVSCRGPGCSGCCRGEVDSTKGEIEAVAAVMTDAQWARVEAFDPPDTKTARCPLLEADGRCGVYAVRPGVCRTFMVISPVDHCYPERSGTQTTQIVFDAQIAKTLSVGLAGTLIGGLKTIRRGRGNMSDPR